MQNAILWTELNSPKKMQKKANKYAQRNEQKE